MNFISSFFGRRPARESFTALSMDTTKTPIQKIQIDKVAFCEELARTKGFDKDRVIKILDAIERKEDMNAEEIRNRISRLYSIQVTDDPRFSSQTNRPNDQIALTFMKTEYSMSREIGIQVLNELKQRGISTKDLPAESLQETIKQSLGFQCFTAIQFIEQNLDHLIEELEKTPPSESRDSRLNSLRTIKSSLETTRLDPDSYKSNKTMQALIKYVKNLAEVAKDIYSTPTDFEQEQLRNIGYFVTELESQSRKMRY